MIFQRCSELVELSQDISVMQEVMPLDSSCEDLEVDSSLSFLDGFVSEALAKGSSSYKPPHLRVASPLPKAPSQCIYNIKIIILLGKVVSQDRCLSSEDYGGAVMIKNPIIILYYP